MQAYVRGRHSATAGVKQDVNTLKLNVVGLLLVHAKILPHLN